MDQEQNDTIRSLYDKGLDLEGIDNFENNLKEKWNETKDSTNPTESRAWLAKRDVYFQEAAALKLVKASILATAAIKDQKKKQSASQKAVEEERLKIIADLESLQRDTRKTVGEKLSLLDSNLQKELYTELDIKRKYQSDLAKVLLGVSAGVELKKENLENLEVVNRLHKKYDVAKEQLIRDGLMEILKDEFANIPDLDEFVAQTVERMASKPDEDIAKAARFVIKSDNKWSYLKNLIKTAESKTRSDVSKKLKSLEIDLEGEQRNLMNQLQNATNARQKERIRQLAEAKLRRERKALQREGNFDQVALLLKSSKDSELSRENQRNIQLELAKKRLESRKALHKQKEKLKELEKSLFDRKTVLAKLDSEMEDVNMSKSDWLDLQQNKERDFLLAIQDVSGAIEQTYSEKSTADIENKLKNLNNEFLQHVTKITDQAIEKLVEVQNEEFVTEKDETVEKNLKAEQIIRLNKILQEAIILKKRLGSAEWEVLLADLSIAQRLESNVHDNLDSQPLLDKLLMQTLKYESIAAIVFNPEKSISKDETFFEQHFEQNLNKIAEKLAEKTASHASNDAEKIKDVQEILAKRRVEAAKQATGIEDENDEWGGNNENSDKVPELVSKNSSSLSKDSKKPKKLKRRLSLNPLNPEGSSQKLDDANKKLEELQLQRKKVEDQKSKQFTAMREALMRRKTKIIEKKQGDQEIAASLLQREKTMANEQTIRLERQKTNVGSRVERLKREKTMLAEKKAENEFKDLNDDEGKRKAEELQKSFMRQKTLATEQQRDLKEIDVSKDDLDIQDTAKSGASPRPSVRTPRTQKSRDLQKLKKLKKRAKAERLKREENKSSDENSDSSD